MVGCRRLAILAHTGISGIGAEGLGQIMGFTAEQVCRLTGLSAGQLRRFERAGFFTPCYGADEECRQFSRLYSFRDVVGLRALALLRNEHHVLFSDLRAVANWLAEHPEASWSSLTFYVYGRRVAFEHPELGVRMAARPKDQVAIPMAMQKIARDVEARVNQLRKRQPDVIGQITRNRHVQSNAPVLAGTRIPTRAIWEFDQAGHSLESIRKQYPELVSKDVRAAISFEQRRQRKAS